MVAATKSGDVASRLGGSKAISKPPGEQTGPSNEVNIRPVTNVHGSGEDEPKQTRSWSILKRWRRMVEEIYGIWTPPSAFSTAWRAFEMRWSERAASGGVP
jgi:hypothetical protein